MTSAAIEMAPNKWRYDVRFVKKLTGINIALNKINGGMNSDFFRKVKGRHPPVTSPLRPLMTLGNADNKFEFNVYGRC